MEIKSSKRKFGIIKKLNKRISLFLCLAMIISLVNIPVANAARDMSTVRVLLSTNKSSSVSLTLYGAYKISSTGAVLPAGSAKATLSSGKLYFTDSNGKKTSGGSSYKITRVNNSDPNTYIKLGNSKYGTITYLGDMQFTIVDGKMYTINLVHIETYLKGVVAHEMSNAFPIEAQKAQAVSARCYVLKAMEGVSSTRKYDIGDTSQDQVYKGYNSNNTNTIKAVDSTANKVLTYNGKICNTYYAATNGGFTDNVNNVWGSSNSAYPYLVLKSDPYDIRNPSSQQYSYALPASSAESKTPASLLKYIKAKSVSPLSAISDVETSSDFTVSGYKDVYWDKNLLFGYRDDSTLKLKIKLIAKAPVTEEVSDPNSADGKTVKTSTKNLTVEITINMRDLINGGYVKDAYRIYSIEKDSNNNFTLYNRRYGHGIGMSQRGAQQMANEGKSYQEILMFYYEGAAISNYNYASENGLDSPAPDPTPAPDPGPQIVATGTVQQDMYVRSTPDTSNKELGVLSGGAKVSILKLNYIDGWHQILYNGNIAYVSSKYITLENQPANKVVKYGSVVVKDYLNIRASASQSSKSIARKQNGEVVNITKLNYNNTFHQIILEDGTLAYVHKDFVLLTNSKKPTVTYPAQMAVRGVVYQKTVSTSKKLGTIAKGTWIPVVKKSASSNYAQVFYKGQYGYVNKKSLRYLSFSKKTTTKVKAGIYLKPTTYAKIATVNKGRSVYVTNRTFTPQFAQLYFGGTYVYIQRKNIK